MAYWIRYSHNGKTSVGTLAEGVVSEHQGDMFAGPEATGNTVSVEEVEILTPCTPSKILALWNNFHATSAKTGLPAPEHPWYFVKTANTYAAHGAVINRPSSCEGKVLFEGELGIVIGKACKDVSVGDVDDYVFGYTLLNDVTAFEFLFGENFDHWTRAKCFDGFGVFGPGIETDVEPDSLTIETWLRGDGEEQQRQNYPVSDMIYGPREIVSHLSRDMTLMPGDIIACGTSVGAGALKDGWEVEIRVEGIGSLVNTYSG